MVRLMAFPTGKLHKPKLFPLPRCLTESGLSSPGMMSEVIVPLLELPGIRKTPPGKLTSKTDFLLLLYGSVDGNFSGFQGEIR